jgi:hypothetical protein
MNCKVVAVILGILALALIASADTLTEIYNTTDGTSVAIDAGQGETFLCSLDAGAFSCTDTDQFTCYGWGNCAALNATTPAPGCAARRNCWSADGNFSDRGRIK